jgi:hypothetical protein
LEYAHKKEGEAMTARRKIKKIADLWDTFRLHQRQSIDLHGNVMGNTLNNIWWKGYVTALSEFGVFSEKDKNECIAWCPV